MSFRLRRPRERTASICDVPPTLSLLSFRLKPAAQSAAGETEKSPRQRMSFRASEAPLSLGTRAITLNAYKMRNGEIFHVKKSVISTGERLGVRSGEISSVTLQIHSFRNIASPSLWGGGRTHERADGEGENFNNIFLFVIPSDSEGSHCPTTAKPMQRYSGNIISERCP